MMALISSLILLLFFSVCSAQSIPYVLPTPSPSPPPTGTHTVVISQSPIAPDSPPPPGLLIAPDSAQPPVPSVVIASAPSSTSLRRPTFYLNSSVPSTWYNNNLINLDIDGSDGSSVRVVLSTEMRNVDFVCGFYCADGCNLSFLSIVIVNGGDPGVVWTANRDYPVKENATLHLTGDGDLVLRDSDGTKVWSTNTAGKSVAGMNITEAGNFVLFNDEGATVWQSFDHPTDSLLPGQRLNENQRLIASTSKSNWSQGLYHATITSATGFALYTEDQVQSLMYYKLLPADGSSSTRDRSNYAELQRGGFVVNLGTTQEMFGRIPIIIPLDSYAVYIKLDSDGHLKIYQHSQGRGKVEMVDMVTNYLGECQHPRICNEYGICREGQCSCPTGIDRVQYFEQSQFQLPNKGCSRITPLSCQPSLNQYHLVEVKNVTYFNVIDSDSADPKIKDIEGCKQACLQNCSCEAIFFRYDYNVSGGYCHMPSKVLTIREGKIPNYNFTSSAYIKVAITPPPSRKRRNSPAIIAGSTAGAFVIVCVVILTLLVNMRKICNTNEEEENIIQLPGMPLRFSYEDLRIATKDFNQKVGEGGFGSVFKGTLGDGTKIAIKRLDKMNQGMKEFLAEVESIGSIHHVNLVRLIGFCAEKSCCLLVYEYMTNGSLDKWIYHRGDRPCLGWETRKKIILDIARGLAYLHEECRQRIAHLDIKPENILLDENFNAKVSDFGLSKLIDRNDSQVVTTMRGTPGYIAPEWRQLRITVKVDVYSFGIVLLEIVSGRRNLDRTRSESSCHLLWLLQKKAEEDQLIDIVENLDEDMQSHREEVIKMIRIGAWCLQDDHIRRPFMSTLVKVLEGVMEVNPSITFHFTHALETTVVANGHISAQPQASVLSNPR